MVSSPVFTLKGAQPGIQWIVWPSPNVQCALYNRHAVVSLLLKRLNLLAKGHIEGPHDGTGGAS